MRTNGKSFTHGDVYQTMTNLFAEKHNLGSGDIESQFQVVEEEFNELKEAVQGNGDIEEECADVLFTIHLLGVMHGFDLRTEFVEKASYNLNKSLEKDENGKITDDA